MGPSGASILPARLTRSKNSSPSSATVHRGHFDTTLPLQVPAADHLTRAKSRFKGTEGQRCMLFGSLAGDHIT